MALLEVKDLEVYYGVICALKGINFEVYLDDYGQSYVLAWINPRTKKIEQWCCGTYNVYQNDMEDIADHILGVRYDNGGH